MEQGFQNKPSKSKEGGPDMEMIKSIKKAISQIEKELEKNDNTEDDTLNLKNTLVELKTKLLKETIAKNGFKKEDSVGDFDSVLDSHIFNHEKNEIEGKKKELKDEYESIENNPNFSEYFKSEIKKKLIEEHINHLRSVIDKSFISSDATQKEKIESLIEELRKYEKEDEEIETFLMKEISSKPELKTAIKRMTEISNEIEKLDKKFEEVFRLSESDQIRKDYEDIPTIGLN